MVEDACLISRDEQHEGLIVTCHGAAKLAPTKTHMTIYTGKFSGMTTKTTRAGMRSYGETQANINRSLYVTRTSPESL